VHADGLEAEEHRRQQRRGAGVERQPEQRARGEGPRGVEGGEQEGRAQRRADDVGGEPDGALHRGEEVDRAEGEEGGEPEVLLPRPAGVSASREAVEEEVEQRRGDAREQHVEGAVGEIAAQQGHREHVQHRREDREGHEPPVAVARPVVAAAARRARDVAGDVGVAAHGERPVEEGVGQVGEVVVRGVRPQPVGREEAVDDDRDEVDRERDAGGARGAGGVVDAGGAGGRSRCRPWPAVCTNRASLLATAATA
jgi:hypothetical protein